MDHWAIKVHNIIIIRKMNFCSLFCLENWLYPFVFLPHTCTHTHTHVYCRFAPSMGLTSWSTSVATAAQWPSTSALEPPTFATLAMMISSVWRACPKQSSPSVPWDPAPSHSREPSVHCTSNTHQQAKSLPLAVECAAMHRHSEEALIV